MLGEVKKFVQGYMGRECYNLNTSLKKLSHVYENHKKNVKVIFSNNVMTFISLIII